MLPENDSSTDKPDRNEEGTDVRERVRALRQKVEKLSETFDRMERELKEASDSDQYFEGRDRLA
jgi:predicted RNase H-like nuclease (RuvC/YqgF family)